MRDTPARAAAVANARAAKLPLGKSRFARPHRVGKVVRDLDAVDCRREAIGIEQVGAHDARRREPLASFRIATRKR